MMNMTPTPGQTVGPFFALGLNYPSMHEVVHPYSPRAITLSGTFRDGAGEPIPDGGLEIFAADSHGGVPRARGCLARATRDFTGFGRAATDDDGRFQVWTTTPAPIGDGAAFFAVIVYARGLAAALHTRIYVPGDEERLATDPLLASLSAAERDTLIARRSDDGHLTHDIRLQGENETVFLAFR